MFLTFLLAVLSSGKYSFPLGLIVPAITDSDGRGSIYSYDGYMLVCAKHFKIPILSLDKALVEVAKKENIPVLEA